MLGNAGPGMLAGAGGRVAGGRNTGLLLAGLGAGSKIDRRGQCDATDRSVLRINPVWSLSLFWNTIATRNPSCSICEPAACEDLLRLAGADVLLERAAARERGAGDRPADAWRATSSVVTRG
jgi:hypothetical protein